MRFKDFISESINDSGLFKAIFILGIPYAGKSYISKEISGKITLKVVNTDKSYEFLMKKYGFDLGTTDKETKRPIVDKAKIITKEMLTNYVNGMLPLIIDGTSLDIDNVLQRMGTLKALGYDVSAVFINVELDTALKRIEKRDRFVDPEIVKKVHEKNEDNKNYLMGEIQTSFEVDNNEGMLTDEILHRAYKKSQSFFTDELKNPIGKRRLEELKTSNKKYLSDIMSYDDIKNRVESWYR